MIMRKDFQSRVHSRGWRPVLIGATALAAVCGSSHLALAQAANAREQAALDVRYLQTELMVAALSCGRPEYHQHYNVFVSKFGNSLKQHGTMLKSYFTREYGKQGITQMDRYVTRLANEASLRSMQQPTFCQDSATLFQRANALEPASLVGFSASIAGNREMVASGPPVAR